MNPDTRTTRQRSADRGNVLPLVLVATVVLGLVVVAVATYAATNLRYGQVVEARAERISAAQGAMDDMLEGLALKDPLCVTAGAGGVDIPFPEPINGASVVVNCRVAGASLPPLDGWALVITGVGAPANSDPLLEFDNSSLVEIGGPVYLQQPGRASFKNPTSIVDGDLFYPDEACAGGPFTDPNIYFKASALSITNLSYTAGGPHCTNRSWSQLFGAGPMISPDVATWQANPAGWNPLFTLVGSCRVFQPGYYQGTWLASQLGTSNYFKSGNYVFDNVGSISLTSSAITMGQINRVGFPAVDNVACDGARIADAATGATLYTKGNTRFVSRANSGLEISGKSQGNATVSLHVLGTTLGFATPLLSSDTGNHKEAAFQGMLWAPSSSVVYGTIPADKAAMLRGGAVVASYRGEPAASASGFLIEVAPSAASTSLLIEATATDATGSNTVRVVTAYRPSTGELAVHSRRVVK